MMWWPRWGRRARIHRQASDWVIRMRGPDAAGLQDELKAWRARSADHEAEYQNAAWFMQASSGATRTPDESAVQVGSSSSSRSRPDAWIVAVTTAVLIGVGSTVAIELRHALQPPTAFASTTATRSVQLSDGSLVTLDPDSRIETHFDGAVRAITLVHGTARFAVAHDAAHPFIVTANDRTVTARGTVFTVGLQHGEVSVRLFEGVVEIAHIAKHPAQAPVRLAPGQRLDTVGARDVVSRPSPVAAIGGQGLRRWVRQDLAKPSAGGKEGGMIRTYDATPLATVLADANQGAAKPIRLGALGLSGLHVEGRFEVGDTRALATTLAAALDLKLEDDGRSWILTRV